MVTSSADLRRRIAAAMEAPPLTPSACPQHVVELHGRQVRLSAPPNEAVTQNWHLLRAHEAASGAESAEKYLDEVREALSTLVEKHPIYWSYLWPAGLELGVTLFSVPGLAKGQAVLELGAGLGAGAVCAALAGADWVLATDVEPRALEFCDHIARENGVAGLVHTLTWDWHRPLPPEWLSDRSIGLLLCADVLYESDAIPRVAQIARDVVCPGGAVIVSDGGADRPYGCEHSRQLTELLCAEPADGHRGLGAPFVLSSSRDCERELVGGRSVGVCRSVTHNVRVLVFTRPS